MKQILILEDDKEITKNLTRLLRTEGYGVTCVETISDDWMKVPEFPCIKNAIVLSFLYEYTC